MSSNWSQDIKDMMIGFGQEVKTKPEIPDEKTIELRKSLCCEEFHEMMEGMGVIFSPDDNLSDLNDAFYFPRENNVDLVKLADGIADLIVVVLGTAHAFGIPIEKVWNEVHRTNMEKLKGPVREDGKRLKPEGWQPPNIKQILLDHGMGKNDTI